MRSRHIIVHPCGTNIADNHRTRFLRWNRRMNLIDIVEATTADLTPYYSLLSVRLNDGMTA
jgi:hypothetical protein